ncbi:MAG: helix-turn-helix domain-containing protein [Firmicutes bacterium]|nr:helix-turn-helix domain-containing protein [Bacillota bacterium]
MNSNIGERIKTLRLAKNLTQQELAKALGCGKATVAAWENNQTESLRTKHLIRLALFFSVRTDYLLGLCT